MHLTKRWICGCLTVWGALLLASSASSVLARPLYSTVEKQAQPLCPQPALARIRQHRIAPGDTLVSIAQRYSLIPATLMGFNPVLRSGAVPVGTDISIPPYNGIRIEVPRGRTWREIAETYSVRADVLFEVNGCQPQPSVVFVPGVNWSPNSSIATPQNRSTPVLRGYPLPNVARILMGYGWQVYPATGRVGFNSGVDLAAEPGTPVLSVGAGTVAFAGEQGGNGNLVVVNHPQGLQTRYAHLASITVRVGQTVRVRDRLGTVGATGSADRPMLHFEVRTNSDLGWVAQDPSQYIDNVDIAQQ